MRRVAYAVARTSLAVCAFLVVLALSRWAPVFAEPPWNVRAGPLALPTLLAAVAAALTAGAPRRPVRRAWWWALAACLGALLAVVALRGAAGLPGEVRVSGGAHPLAPGPIDLIGDDWGPRGRRLEARWTGRLHAPRPGWYRLWATGRGRVEVRLDGQRVMAAESDPLRAGAPVLLSRGAHAIEVSYEWAGPGPRLRLGWTRPARHGGPGSWSEAIPPRFLDSGETTGARPLRWRVADALALGVAVLAGALAFQIRWARPDADRRPRPWSAREAVASVVGHAAVLAALSWPMARDPAGLGVIDRPDGRLNAWIMAWDVHALLHRPADLFQAPIFHPLPDALAFSEHLLLPAVLTAPAQLLGGPVLAYNLAFLGCALAGGLGVQLLVRRVSGDGLAAFAAGALFAAGPHRWVNMPHLHAHAVAFLPLALWALDRFWERRTFGRALWVGAFVVLQGLTSIYVASATVLLLGTALSVAAVAGTRWRDGLRLAAALALSAIALLPVARPYFRMRAHLGQEFTAPETALYATTPPSYLASGTRWLEGLGRRHLDPQRVRDPLFPGVALLGLGVLGLAAAPARFRAVAVVASTVAVLMSLGPATFLQPFLHDHIVFFRGIRALGRFALVPVFSLAVLAGLALAGRRRLVVLLAIGAGLAEACPAPLRLAPYAGPPAAARWLAGQDGAVVYLPLGERDTEAMLDGVAHFRPLVNGDSGFVPRPYVRAVELLGGRLGEEGWRLLRALGVRHVVSRTALPLPEAAGFGDERVYVVPPGEPARLVASGEALRTAATRGGLTADLGAPRELAAVVFPLGEGSWCARPRVRLSLEGARWADAAGAASLADATLTLMNQPRDGKGDVRFSPARARFVRLDPCLPARAGGLWLPP